MKTKILSMVLACVCVGNLRADDNALDEENAISALAEVNALREARGQHPFVYDEGLARAAAGCAAWRADRLMEGHTPNDFAALPPGVHARSAGCAAWHPSLGWGSCCIHDQGTYAGAAWVMGRNGKRHMHLFVR